MSDLLREICESVLNWILRCMHCKEIWIYVFSEKKLCGLSSNFVSLGDQYTFLRSAQLFSCS
jgi:hypothetical protein